jgi:hypothetical protein
MLAGFVHLAAATVPRGGGGGVGKINKEASSWAMLPGWRRAGGDRSCLDGSRVEQLR